MTSSPVSGEHQHDHLQNNNITEFSAHLKASKRIVALLGAGLSAPSGIPTFRGAGSSWRGISVRDLADIKCLETNPVLFWHFYNHRRHLALEAKPNLGHYALAELSNEKDCLAISQNIDGLSQRAGHKDGSLVNIHGSLFEIECSNTSCEYAETNYIDDPIVPGLTIPNNIDISDATTPFPPTRTDDLPHCPCCGSLMRPSVVLFAERLYQTTLDTIDEWFEKGPIDLLLVVGTSAVVDPAASYIHLAWEAGARVAVVNMDAPGDDAHDRYGCDHWYFQGDAAKLLPLLLEGVVEIRDGPRG